MGLPDGRNASVTGSARGLATVERFCKESARHGIRVDAIRAGFTRTAMTDSMPQDVPRTRAAEIPIGRTIEVSGGRSM